jgi:large subunit ribosomal protein L24
MRVLKYRRAAGRRPALRHAANRARVRMHVMVGDTVRVMRGEDKGKEGKILRIYHKTGRVTVDGVNIVKRHRKARRPEEQSQIMEHPAPIHASNVMLLDPQSGRPTRVRIRVDDDGTKERLAIKSGEPVPRPQK